MSVREAGTVVPLRSGERPTISVVICAYTERRWDELVAAVESVGRQTLPAAEIIVVVDHNAALGARARRELPDVSVLENHHLQGLAGARNTGVTAARGTVVAFLDDDAIAASDWLERLAEAYVGPLVLGVGGSIEPVWVEGRPRAFPREFDWVVGCTYRGMPNRRQPVRNLIGANMSIRRDVIDEIGAFQDGIGRVGTRPMGCEETELCLRASKHWPFGVFLYEPRAAVLHRVPGPRASRGYFLSRCWSEGLSKASVARSVGADGALASERTYATRTLPRGVAAGLADLLRGDTGGLARAATIVSGFAVTTAGYVTGRMTGIRSRTAS